MRVPPMPRFARGAEPGPSFSFARGGAATAPRALEMWRVARQDLGADRLSSATVFHRLREGNYCAEGSRGAEPSLRGPRGSRDSYVRAAARSSSGRPQWTRARAFGGPPSGGGPSAKEPSALARPTEDCLVPLPSFGTAARPRRDGVHPQGGRSWRLQPLRWDGVTAAPRARAARSARRASPARFSAVERRGR